MNFYRSLTRNPNAIKTRTAAAEPEALRVATAVASATPITSGTNVKTTTTQETETTAVALQLLPPAPVPLSPPQRASGSASTAASVGNTHDSIYNNFICFSLPAITSAVRPRTTPKRTHCCCPTTAINCSSLTSHKGKKITQQHRSHSRRMGDMARGGLGAGAEAATTSNSSITPEVMPPLTSMSDEQISLTSRVNVMDKDVANEETTTAAPTTITTPTVESSASASATQQSLCSRRTRRIVTTTHPAASTPSTASTPSSRSPFSGGSRNLYQNIKMPLRRLILTLMAAVVLSTEFTICGSTSVLEQKLKTISLTNSNSSNVPAATTTTTTATNKSSKISDSLPNLPVTPTTLTATLSLAPSIQPSSSSSLSMAFSKSSSSSSSSSVASSTLLSATSISTSMERKSLKSLETAALTEALPSSVSSAKESGDLGAVVEMDISATAEKSPFLSMSSSLTATTLTQSEPLTLDDFNASSELLSGPTSILNTYDASDLPPLTEAEQAAKDLLTKGFSIPTYLPPFPVFAVADLPAYLNTVSSTTTEAPSNHHMSPDDMSSLENLLYFDNTGDQQQQHQQRQQHRKLQIPRRNSSLAGANNVTVQEGNHAYLPCRIHRLQNKPVSWVRLRDGHIISVDQTTFIADQRFQAIFQDDKEYTWSLQIKYVQQTDEGWFECQASSEPKMSAKVYLRVVVPLTELIGDQSRFVKAGSKVALHCIVRGTLDPPQYIIWYRDKTQISEDNKMGWYTQLDRNIFGNNGDNENTIGSLIIPSVRKVDSGNYTCQPSNSASVSVDLHVLSGEYSASAIMSAARTYALNDAYLLILLLLMLLHNT